MEWSWRTCFQLCEKITVGIVVRPAQYYVAEGVPALRSANIREFGIDPSDLAFISPEANALLSKSQVKEGDIVTVRTGYPGTSAVVPLEFSGANCIDILISRPGPLIRSAFLANWINSAFGKDQVLRRQGGLAQQHFNVGEMRDLLVVLPELSEQSEIMKCLHCVSEKIRSEAALRDKLILQKHGLMHDLLTGRVRVRVAEPADEAA
jgi:type I restriction enzyme S subunit